MSDSTTPPQAESTTSEADADHGSGDAAPDERSVAGISDDQLPEELQPGDDNPLANPLDPEDPNTRSPEELEVTSSGEEPGDTGDTEDSGNSGNSGDASDSHEGDQAGS